MQESCQLGPVLPDLDRRMPRLTGLDFMAQVQQLVACSGCGPQGSVQPLAFEQMFFNVSAAGMQPADLNELEPVRAETAFS